jgi:hypothetical protein
MRIADVVKLRRAISTDILEYCARVLVFQAQGTVRVERADYDHPQLEAQGTAILWRTSKVRPTA